MSTALTTTGSGSKWEDDPIGELEKGFANRRSIVAALIGESVTSAPQTDRIFAVAGAKYRALLNALKPSDQLIDPFSVVDCVLQAAQLGLEAGSDQAYLVPYGGRVSLIVSPRGLIDLAFRHPAVQDVDAEVVRKGDSFAYELGDKPFIRHTKGTSADVRGADLEFVYAVVRLCNGGIIRSVLTAPEVAFYRAFSKSKTGPWLDNTAAMWRKTALKRAFSKGPRSPQMAMALNENELGHYVEPGTEERKLPPRTIDMRVREVPQDATPALPPAADHVHINGDAAFAASKPDALLGLLAAARDAGNGPAAEMAFALRVSFLFGTADATSFDDLTAIARDANIANESPARTMMLRARKAADARIGTR